MFAWKKASDSGAYDCVEVQHDVAGVRVRHSKFENSPVITYTETEWSAFLAAVKRGEFDIDG